MDRQNNNPYNVMRGIASQVYQTRSTILVDNWERDTVYECQFRLSGQPILLRLRNPIYIGDGEQLILVGIDTTSGIFEAKAYRNVTAGVIDVATASPAEEAFLQNLIAAGVIIAIITFIILPLFHVSWREYNWILNVLGLLGIISILFAIRVFKRNKRRRKEMYEILECEYMNI